MKEQSDPSPKRKTQSKVPLYVVNIRMFMSHGDKTSRIPSPCRVHSQGTQTWTRPPSRP